MSMTEKEWSEEQDRVKAVTSQISKSMELLEVEVGLVHTDIADIRKNFWDEVTVNLSTSEDVSETYLSVRQQAEVLSERERRHRHSVITLEKLRRLIRSPYFGRIDFVEDGDNPAEQIYLGITSFQDESSGSFLIYDWRAPISSLFYDYQPGPVVYEAPGGEIKGTLLKKRQYLIRD